jgi:hypothetical protein
MASRDIMTEGCIPADPASTWTISAMPWTSNMRPSDVSRM